VLSCGCCGSDSVESDLHFVGLIVFENKLKAETTPVIRELRDADIRTVMVTGMSYARPYVGGVAHWLRQGIIYPSYR